VSQEENGAPAGDGVFVTDGDGRIILWNAAAERILGTLLCDARYRTRYGYVDRDRQAALVNAYGITVQNILQKLGIHSRLEAVATAGRRQYAAGRCPPSCPASASACRR
jgi:PAS domain-containing protein